MKYICTYCNVYAYDEEKGDPGSKLQPGTKIDDIPDSWLCPVCGMPKDYLQEVRDEIFSLKMTAYTETQHETTGSELLPFHSKEDAYWYLWGVPCM